MYTNPLFEYLATLVSLRTVTGDFAANDKGLDFLQRFFEQQGLFVERFRFNGVGSLVATTKKGEKKPAVMLAAHLDVVSADNELFSMREEDGKLLGRGVYDMKFAIAAYMNIVSGLGSKPQSTGASTPKLADYNLGIMITTDEESGGADGVRRLVEMGYKPGVCVLPDGGENWNLETQAKGFIYADLEVVGKVAHGSRPWEGDSASLKIIGLLADLSKFFGEQAFNTNTLNVSLIETEPGSLTQIPGSAHAQLDIRYLAPSDYQAITQELDTLCAKYDAIYKERDFCGNPCINRLSHPLIRPFAESIEKITGYAPSGTLSGGASDARYFAKVGVPCILTHPRGGEQHSADEWIDTDDYVKFAEVVLDYVHKMAVSRPQ